MNNVFYRATYLQPDGRVVSRPYFLSSAREVRREVSLAGYTLMDIRELSHGAWWQREIYTNEYKREFLRSVMFYVETGISPTEALLRVLLAERNERKRAEFAPAIAAIRGGGRFSQAVELTGMFDPTLLLLLQSGELIGIRKVVPAVEALMDRRDNLRKFVGTVASVLSLELFTAVSSAMAIKWYALPYVAKSFVPNGAQNDAEKAATQALMAKLANVNLYNDIMLAIAVIIALACVVGVLIWFSSARGRERVTALIRYLPGGKALIYHANLSDGFAVASSMLGSGITLSTVLTTLAMGTRNPAVSAYWGNSLRRLHQGLPVATALTDEEVLTEPEIVALNAHRNVSQLARVAASIGERRSHAAQLARMNLVKVTTVLTVSYILAVVGAAIWMLLVQDEGMGMMMKALG